MSEFDKLKDEAEKEIQEHPEQFKEGEQAIEKRLGVDSRDDQHDQGNAPQDDRAASRRTPSAAGQGNRAPLWRPERGVFGVLVAAGRVSAVAAGRARGT